MLISSISQQRKLFTASKMRTSKLFLILIAIYLIHCESLAKGISKDKLEINVETFIRFDIIIFSTTIVKTTTLRSFSSSDQSKVSTLSSIKSAGTCISRLTLITKVISTITSIASTLVIYTTTTPTSRTIDSVSSCNATTSFDFVSSSKQMLLENYRVNNFIQIFEVYCNHNVLALASNNNLDLVDFQIISASNIITCIISCAIYNHQRSVEYNDWISLCSTINLMKNTCYLKININVSHKTNVVSWENAHTAFLRFW